MSTSSTLWQQQLKETGYIWSLSAAGRWVVVLGPVDSRTLFVVDANDGRIERSLRHDGTIHSVAVTEEGRLIAARGSSVTGETSEHDEPEILLGTVDERHLSGFRSFPLSQAIPYDRELLFGKIVLIPGKEKALITGVSDRIDTMGFLLLLDWGTQSLSVLARNLAEAPQDIVVANGRAYVPTGRRGSIYVIDLDYLFSGSITAPSFRGGPFKPVRITATGNHVVAASYNQLFWWQERPLPNPTVTDDGIRFDTKYEFIKRESLSGPMDCINGLATLSDGTVLTVLTFSGRLVLKASPDDVGTTLAAPIKDPCHAVVGPNDNVYLTGYSSGMIAALPLSHIPSRFLVGVEGRGS